MEKVADTEACKKTDLEDFANAVRVVEVDGWNKTVDLSEKVVEAKVAGGEYSDPDDLVSYASKSKKTTYDWGRLP